MQRRKFMVGMGSLAAGAAATLGTGAFSSGQLQRGMKAHVANDTNAYVQLTKGNGAKHVSFSNGLLQLDFTNSTPPSNNNDFNGGATGLNDEALSYFDSVVIAKIKDPDPQAVQLNPPWNYVGYVTTDAPHVSFYWDSNQGTSIMGSGNAADFVKKDTDSDGKPEELWFPIGVKIDLRNTPNISPGDDILSGKHFTFHIEQEST